MASRMEMDFEKLNSYFGPQATLSNSVQFNLPTAETFKPMCNYYEDYVEVKKLLDVHYQILTSDISCNFLEVTSISVETKHRTNIVCCLANFRELHNLEKRYETALNLEIIHKELKEKTGKEYLDDYFKIQYELIAIKDKYDSAMEVIKMLEDFINDNVEEIKDKINAVVK